MARNITYHMSEAYNLGYDDGYKDATNKVCEILDRLYLNIGGKPCKVINTDILRDIIIKEIR